MLKNTAGQKVGAQMITAADGTAFTSSVTAYVTLDAGSQAQGSVSSGACTHEGNGYHTYAPSQAETNGDLCAFTFIGTGAIPATVQIYTRAGDAFTRLGAPAGASTAVDIAAIKTVADAVKAKTDNLPSDPADASVVAGLLDALPTAAENAAEVLSAAASSPIAANVKQVNDVALTGDGSAGDKFDVV